MSAKAVLKSLGVKSGVEAFVKLGYGDMFDLPVRSLDFRTESTSIPELLPAIRLVESYNAFRGATLAEVLDELWQRKLALSAEFGRENSPVVYVYPGRDVDPAIIMDALKHAGPDELSEESGGYRVRAWWD